MKIGLNNVRNKVSSIVSEARKKKDKSEKQLHKPSPKEYGYAESFDFSSPLGGYNLYKSQGASNWGPMTGPGQSIDDKISVPKSAKLAEDILKLAESIPKSSAWSPVLKEAYKIVDLKNSKNVWEKLNVYLKNKTK